MYRVHTESDNVKRFRYHNLVIGDLFFSLTLKLLFFCFLYLLLNSVKFLWYVVSSLLTINPWTKSKEVKKKDFSFIGLRNVPLNKNMLFFSACHFFFVFQFWIGDEKQGLEVGERHIVICAFFFDENHDIKYVNILINVYSRAF